MTRRPRGFWRDVVALAQQDMLADEIAATLDCGVEYVRATCRRQGVPLKGKRACRK